APDDSTRVDPTPPSKRTRCAVACVPDLVGGSAAELRLHRIDGELAKVARRIEATLGPRTTTLYRAFPRIGGVDGEQEALREGWSRPRRGGGGVVVSVDVDVVGPLIS